MEQSYKEKYEKVLDNARLMYDAGNNDVKHIVGKLFPELKESEDEKVRKSLIHLVHLYGGEFGMIDANTSVEEAITWLEKQEGCEHIKKDWLEHIKQSWYKEGFIDGKYSGGTSKEWTINDATTLSELIDFLENGTAKLQHDLTRYANWLKIQFTPIEKQGEPKTKENKGNIGGISANSAWSEEDEINLQGVIDEIEANKNQAPDYDLATYDRFLSWLKSLQDRVQPQPKQEWSEEDKYMYDILCGTIENTDINENTKYKLISWLKSLRPQK